jgi:hypothetical protein
MRIITAGGVPVEVQVCAFESREGTAAAVAYRSECVGRPADVLVGGVCGRFVPLGGDVREVLAAIAASKESHREGAKY